MIGTELGTDTETNQEEIKNGETKTDRHVEKQKVREKERIRDITCFKGFGTLSGAEPCLTGPLLLGLPVMPSPSEHSLHLGSLSFLGLHDTPLLSLVSFLANY